jgi:fatty acid desaturase
LRTDLQETLISLDKSSADYKTLSTAWETYRADAETQLAEISKERDKERARADRLKMLAIVGWVAAGIAGGALGLHFAGAW